VGFFDEAGITAFAEWGGKGRLLTGVNCGAVCSGKGDSALAAHVGTGARGGAPFPRCIHALARCMLHSRIHALPRCMLHPRIGALHGARHTAHVASPAAGEVVKFASAACESMCAAGANVLLEGRAQTLQRAARSRSSFAPHSHIFGIIPLKAHSHLALCRPRPIPTYARSGVDPFLAVYREPYSASTCRRRIGLS
jgi:hypothetical protein